jgi:alpha-tubulin suppressor-like RCC1 family protein
MTGSRRALLALPGVLALTLGLGVQPAQAQSGAVYRWGAYRTVGFGVSGPQKVPTLVPGVTDVVALAAGNSATYALTSSGAEWAWGNNSLGQLGNGTRANSLTSPVQVQFPAGVDATAIGEGDDMAFAVDSSGHGWSWGWNGRGNLCLGTHHGHDVPVRVPGLSNLVAVQAGGGSVIWLTASGQVYTCGATSTGQHATPALVRGLPAGDPVVAISAGNAYSTALLRDGQIWDWGIGGAGQLGDGTTANSAYPVRVDLPAGTHATQVYSGGDLGNDGHQLAILNTGQVVAWGNDACGQLGVGKPAREPTPLPVVILGGITASYVAAGGTTSYVIDTQGNLWAWGSNKGGQVRSPTSKCARLTKVDTGVRLVSATASDVVDYHG